MPGHPLSIPSPNELAKNASFNDADQLRLGSEYLDTLPHDLIDRSNMIAQLSPDYTGSTGAAYGMYSFNLQGYDEDPVITAKWVDEQNTDGLWLGLGNWARNTWDWYPTGNVLTTPDDLDKYIRADGAMLIVALGLGNKLESLAYIQIGTIDGTGGGGPETVNITHVAPSGGVPGQQVRLTAFADGTAPLSYYWNFGVAAFPNASTADQPIITLRGAGTYPCTLEVSNRFSTDTYNFNLYVLPNGSWTHTVGTTEYSDKAGAMDINAAGNIFFASEAVGGRFFVTRCTSLGATTAVQLYSSAFEMYYTPTSIQADPADNCYVAIKHWDPFDPPGVPPGTFLLKIDPAMSIVWAQELGSMEDARLELANGMLLLTDIGSGRVIALDTDGQVVWAKAATDFGIRCTSTDATGNIYLSGEAVIDSAFPTDSDVGVIAIDSLGSVLWQKSWGTPNPLSDKDQAEMAQDAILDGSNLLLSANRVVPSDVAGVMNCLLLSVDSATGTLNFGSEWLGGVNNGVSVFPAGQICVAGALPGQFPAPAWYQQATLHFFDPTGVLLDAWQTNAAVDTTVQEIATYPDGSLLLAGSAYSTYLGLEPLPATVQPIADLRQQDLTSAISNTTFSMTPAAIAPLDDATFNFDGATGTSDALLMKISGLPAP